MAPSTHFYGFKRSFTWILLILSQVDRISSLPLQDAAVFPLPQAAVDKIADVLPDSLYDLPLSVNMLEGRAAMPQSAIVTPSSSAKKSKDAASKTATSFATSVVTSQPASAAPSDTAGLITTITSGGLTIQSVIPDLEPGTTGVSNMPVLARIFQVEDAANVRHRRSSPPSKEKARAPSHLLTLNLSLLLRASCSRLKET